MFEFPVHDEWSHAFIFMYLANLVDAFGKIIPSNAVHADTDKVKAVLYCQRSCC